MRARLFLFLLLTLTAVAQQPQPQKTAGGPDDQYTLKVSTQLVIEAVTVNDKNGKPIEDLTAKDFKITEDGVPQTISIFDYQKIEDDAATPAVTPSPASATPSTPV